ncbi:hypothetical protein SAMN04487819_105100 [Actinopolyspora alba]|uniref:Uncharacterized protein n=1 Tax=Actinopolyspora alba TaxID=673379 RepID=A0A1I1WA48_9ACTN|nr:hypothetical protein SAMN04487819_105100 [Actinopolyspora alba]
MPYARKSMYLILPVALLVSFVVGFSAVKIWPDNIVLQRAVTFSGVVVVTLVAVLAYFYHKKG